MSAEHVHDENCIVEIEIDDETQEQISKEVRSIARSWKRWQIASIVYKVIAAAFAGWTLARAIVENDPWHLAWLGLSVVMWLTALSFAHTANIDRDRRLSALTMFVAGKAFAATLEKMNAQTQAENEAALEAAAEKIEEGRA